ncbi:MAG: hypothetical protein K2X84_12990, partial [Beijerinckiaceae bacterium]|nr:hypothetical protein [Beijerinckiaceae bacterium]
PRGVERWSRLHNPYLSVIVIEHARAGTRPDHGGVLPTFRGRPTEERRRQRAEVMLARAIYATWHASIGLLAAELDSVMDRHHVLAPVSPAAPWEAAKAGDLLGSQAGMAVPEHNSSGSKGLKQQAI